MRITIDTQPNIIAKVTSTVYSDRRESDTDRTDSWKQTLMFQRWDSSDSDSSFSPTESELSVGRACRSLIQFLLCPPYGGEMTEGPFGWSPSHKTIRSEVTWLWNPFSLVYLSALNCTLCARMQKTTTIMETESMFTLLFAWMEATQVEDGIFWKILAIF